MTVMATTRDEFSTNGNSTVRRFLSSTVQKPRFYKFTRKLAQGKQTKNLVNFSISAGTVDSLGNVMPSQFKATVSIEDVVGGLAADKTWLLATLQDLIQSTELGRAADEYQPITVKLT